MNPSHLSSRPRRRLLASLMVGVGSLTALVGFVLSGPTPTGAADTTAGPLVGTFQFAPGTYSGGAASGTYFRMIQPGGTVAAGPFLSNGSSSSSDQTYTLLSPGSDGGLITGSYQPEPNPGFDSKDNSLASRIIQPTAFYGVNFSIDTAATDPQTQLAVPAPSVTVDSSGNLSGNLSAWGASWNLQEFNQGSPKPDGTETAPTTAVTGTYDQSSGAYSLSWSSLIVGGPFDKFIGYWHLQGTFIPAPGTGPTTTTTSTTTTTAPPSTTTTTTAPTSGATTTTTTTPTSGTTTTTTTTTVPSTSTTSTTTPPAGATTTTAPSSTAAASTGTAASASSTDVGSTTTSSITPGPLVGTFRLTPGSSTATGATGTYFQMVDPGGNNLTGPYITNTNSTATDKTYTLLSPGTDGGLETGSYQSEPSPGFDGSGNSLSARIIQPTKFFGIYFGISTNAVDPQTQTSAPAPSISFNSADQLSGNLSAWAASWNKEEFNQGAPKPGGGVPGNTMGSPVGSYNPVTGAFTLIWASQIVGGPFNNFTGVWHLQGTFVSANGTVGSVVHVTSSTANPAQASALAFTGMSPWPLRAGLALVLLGALILMLDRKLRLRGLTLATDDVEPNHT